MLKSLIFIALLFPAPAARAGDRVEWRSAEGLLQMMKGASCSVVVSEGEDKSARTLPVTAREVGRTTSDQIFSGLKTHTGMGRIQLALFAPHPTQDFAVYVAQKGERILVLLSESTRQGLASAKYAYQTEDTLVGPVFELSGVSRRYQFQCVATMPEQPDPWAVAPTTGGRFDTSAGSGAL